MENYNLFKDIIGSLNDKRSNLFDDDPEIMEKEYNSYIVNLCYSYGVYTILYANEVNCRSQMNKKMQYDFYFYGLPKAKRFNKFLKADKIENMELIAEYYNCSDKKAKEIVDIFTEDQIKIIKKKLYKGEIKKNGRNADPCRNRS